MIDIHCHILPEMGRGPNTLKQILTMATAAVEEGISVIIATPKYQSISKSNTVKEISGAVRYVNKKLIKENIPLTILPGQEIQVYGDMIKDLHRGILAPLNKTSRYLLIRLPDDHVPHYFPQLQFDLQIAGYVPIIAHPERNKYFMKYPDAYYHIVSKGALTQVTASSLVGKHGRRVRKFAYQLIEANLTHFVASNAYNTKKCAFYMKEAYQIIDRRFGRYKAEYLQQNARDLIKELTIVQKEPYRI